MTMPLNRDQQYSRNLSPLGTSSLAAKRFLDPSQESTGFTSDVQDVLRDENTGETWRGQAKDVQSAQDLQKHKLPLPTMILDKNKHNRSLLSTTGQNLASRQSGTAEGRKTWKAKGSIHVPVNAFDDTESFNQTELDRDDAEEVTAVLRLDFDADTRQKELSRTGQIILSYPVQESSKKRIQNKIGPRGLQDDLETLKYKGEVERQTQNPIHEVVYPTEPLTFPDEDDFDMDVDTPSRTQVVARPAIVHGLKKRVEFVSDAEIFGSSISSPFVQSAELAREPSPDLQDARTNQGRPRREESPHNNHEQGETILRDRLKNNTATLGQTSSRFTKPQAVKSHVLRQSDKVSAPDSDAQESSDDEQVHIPSKGKEGAVNLVSPTRKRPHDWNTKPEYSLDDMRHKKLSDFQEEPFLTSPRTKSKTLDDSDTHEASLALQLLKLQEYSEDEQRKIFQAQKDEEWIETGQWFVDKFQEDLQKLMATRLERRKIALKYEDRLRRRQKEVEAAQSSVEKELRELESGGGELIRNRKAPSRAGTPMKLS